MLHTLHVINNNMSSKSCVELRCLYLVNVFALYSAFDIIAGAAHIAIISVPGSSRSITIVGLTPNLPTES